MSITYTNGVPHAGSRRRLAFSPRTWIAYFELVLQVRRERAALKRLSAWQIADLGLDPGAVVREGRRGLLDLPRSRLSDLG